MNVSLKDSLYKYRRKILYIVYILILLSDTLFSQGENNKWYFGSNAAMDFNSGAPVAIAGSALNTSEGSASIADAAGNLLFYTDGKKVWNKNNVRMPNGDSLWGNPSTTQSALIVKQPGSSTKYYLFTCAAQVGIAPFNSYTGVSYSVVDMTLNGGKGDVIAVGKNTALLDNACEKLTAVKHCNGIDQWIIVHKWGNDAFYAYRLTPTGISDTVISNVGVVNQDLGSGGNTEAMGCLKASPNGKKLASAIYIDLNQVQLFDFDNVTGSISNPITITYPPPTTGGYPAGYNGPYGVSFSPDNQKLYVSINFDKPGHIYQYDISSNVQSTILASEYTVATTTVLPGFATIQAGPNGKLYIANQRNVDVINNPNTLGAGCNFVANAVNLGFTFATYGLPNFVDAITPVTVSPLTPVITSQNPPPCEEGSITLDAGSGYTSYLWSPGGATSQTITVNASGTYSVVVATPCSTGSNAITVTVISQSLTVLSAVTNTTCGKNNGSATVNPFGGIAPYTYQWNPSSGANNTVTGLTAGTYTIIVLDAIGCTKTQAITILPSATGPTATVNANPINIGIGENTTLSASGGVTYQWNNGSIDSTISVAPLVTTIYCVTATDINGCSDSTCVTVNVETKCRDLFIPTAFSPNSDNYNDCFHIYGIGGCFKSFYLTIYDRWGEKIFSSKDPISCWDGVYKNKELKTGIFVYYLQAITLKDEEINKRGNISLIR